MTPLPKSVRTEPGFSPSPPCRLSPDHASRTPKVVRCAASCPAASRSVTAASTSPNRALMQSACSMRPLFTSSNTSPSAGILPPSPSRPTARHSTSSTPRAKAPAPTPARATTPICPPTLDRSSWAVSAPSLLTSLPSAESLTQTVIASNTAASANRPPLPHLKHCFLVVRENRTYDEVLGDVAGANGDPSLARYGMDGWAAEEKSATHLKVTPNLHALVGQYAMSDNFYVDSDVSADGHRWVVGINPTPFFNTAWTSGYGGRRRDFAEARATRPASPVRRSRCPHARRRAPVRLALGAHRGQR